MTETTDDRLRLHIEAAENLIAEKKAVQDDLTDRFKLAKAEGYDPKAMKAIIKLRSMTPDDRATQDAILDTYKCALGID